MDNETVKTNDVNNTSTQKTVRIKPMVKQPLVNINTESQSVKKVATGTGLPAGGVVTNTARIVKLNTPSRPVVPVPTPAAAPAPAPTAPAAPAPADTKTAAIPKAPAPVKPAINIPASADNTQTAAISKPVISATPRINIDAAKEAAAAPAVDDATVKLVRPVRKTAPAPAPAPVSATAPTVAAPVPKTPEVKMPLSSKTPTVALAPKKNIEPAPVAAPAEAKPVEAKIAEAKPAEAKPAAKKAAKAVQANSEMAGFRLSIGFFVTLFLLAAVTFCTVQYFNMYKPGVFGRYIQIPFMENVGK